MAAARKPAPRKGAGAAAAARVKTAEFRGLKLILPEKLPGSLLFDLGEMESDSVGAALKMLESLIGRDQYLAVRAKVQEDQVPFDEVEEQVVDLLTSVLDAFGLNMGESEAS